MLKTEIKDLTTSSITCLNNIHSIYNEKRRSPTCTHCRVPLTVKHILIKCRAFTTEIEYYKYPTTLQKH